MAETEKSRMQIEVTAKTDDAKRGLKEVSDTAKDLGGELENVSNQSERASTLLDRLKKYASKMGRRAIDFGAKNDTTSVRDKAKTSMQGMKSKSLALNFNADTRPIDVVRTQLGTLSKQAIGVGKTMTKVLVLKGLKGVGAIIDNTAGRFANAIKKMSRGLINVAKYRMFRFVISQLTRALKEGITNLNAYSSAIGGTFASAMNSMATNALYVKNSLAVMVAPILTAVAPAIDYLTSRFVACTNAMAQFFAFLTGKGTWTKAKKSATSFGASAQKATGGASKGVKKLKKDLDLLSFDEINKLSADKDSGSGGGGGGGAGGGGLSANDMFEEANVSFPAKMFSKMVKDGWKKANLTGVGAIIGAKLNAMFRGINWSGIQGGVDNMFKRLATFLNGFNLTFDFANITRTIGMAFVTALNGATTFIKTFDWNRLGYQIVRLIEGIPIGKLLSSATNFALAVAKGLIDLLSGVAVTIYNELNKTLGKTVNSLAKMGVYAVKGFFNGIKDGVKSVATFVYDVLFKPFVDAVKSLFEIHSPSKVMDGLGVNIVDGLLNGIKSGAGAILKWFASLPKKIIALLGGVKGKTITIKTKLAKSGWTTLEAFMKSTKTYSVKTKLTKSGWTSLSKFIGIDKTYQVKTKVSKIKDLASKLGLNDYFTVHLKYPNIKGSVSIDTKAKTSSVNWRATGTYSKFAQGGFPKSGEIYMARENGINEYVGSFGNKNAVANNEQIKDGIASAVYPAVFSAMMNAMDKGALTSNVWLQGDADRLFKVVRDKDKQYRQATGKSAFVG